jgi:hypothetical protein
MIAIENAEQIVTIAFFIATIVVGIIVQTPKMIKNVQIGTVLFAYIRNISGLIIHKMLNDWKDLPLPVKIDRLQQVYYLIDSYDQVDFRKYSKDENVDLTKLRAVISSLDDEELAFITDKHTSDIIKDQLI